MLWCSAGRQCRKVAKQISRRNNRDAPPPVNLIIDDTHPKSFSASGDQPARTETPWLLQSHLPTYAKELVAGGVAGGIAKTAVAPLERIKILYQTKQVGFQEAGIWRSLKHLLRTEGLHGFYRGNGASVARVVPYAALHFMTYEQYRRWIVDCYHPAVQISPAVDLMAGSLAGATAVLFTYPLDLIRTRLAYQTKGISNGQGGILDAFRAILRQGGMRALYKGIGPTLWGILPYAGLKFYIYESLRDLFPDPGGYSVTQKLGCGAVAGVVAQTVTYPLDVVRRQMQVGDVNGRHRGLASRGTWGGVVGIVREQGWRQLYAGLHINFFKVVPSVAIGFTVYDFMRAWLKVPPRQKRSGRT